MKIIPELNYWIYQRYFEGPINEHPFEFPVEVSEGRWSVNNSVLNLLFNDTFKENAYQILYKEIAFQSLNDYMLTTRLSAYRSTIQIYECSRGAILPFPPPVTPCSLPNENGENIFDFTEEETRLLNVLFDYRTTGTDSSAELDIIVFDDLESGLSKLIYIYLQLMIYDNFEIYNNDITYANPDRLIELIFEKYVVDSYFRVCKNSYLVLDTTTTLAITELQSKEEVFTLTDSDITTKQVVLSHIPRELEDVTVIIDGNIKKITFDYDIYIQESLAFLTWADLDLAYQLSSGDKIYVSYSYEIT